MHKNDYSINEFILNQNFEENEIKCTHEKIITFYMMIIFINVPARKIFVDYV